LARSSRSNCTIRLDARTRRPSRGLPLMKALHVLPGLGSGGAERMVANLMRTLDRERFEARVIS
jgi:hypothetical protein